MAKLEPASHSFRFHVYLATSLVEGHLPLAHGQGWVVVDTRISGISAWSVPWKKRTYLNWYIFKRVLYTIQNYIWAKVIFGGKLRNLYFRHILKN